MGEELIDIHDLGFQLKIPVKTIRNKLLQRNLAVAAGADRPGPSLAASGS